VNDTSLEARQIEQGYHYENFQITFYGAPDSFAPNINCEQGVSQNDGSNTIAHPYCPWNGGYRGQYGKSSLKVTGMFSDAMLTHHQRAVTAAMATHSQRRRGSRAQTRLCHNVVSGTAPFCRSG
jgi:hypothetical protein